MRITRIYQPCPLAPGQRLRLDEGAGNHVGRVLRLQPGATLVVFNGEGGEHPAEILDVRRNRVDVLLGEHRAREVESPLPVTLFQGISKGDRMDYTVQKAVELGVSAIVPVITERTVVNLSGSRWEKKQRHWQGIANAACEQSGRNRVPKIAPPRTLREQLAGSEASSEAGVRLVLAHRAARTASELPEAVSAATLLIGPEGGLSDGEIELAERSGFTPLRLGPRILRTETASLVALTLLQARWGDIG